MSVLVDYPWVRPSPWRRALKQEGDPEGDHALFVQAVIDIRRGLDLLAARSDDSGHELNDPQALIDRAACLRDKIGIGPLPAGR